MSLLDDVVPNTRTASSRFALTKMMMAVVETATHRDNIIANRLVAVIVAIQPELPSKRALFSVHSYLDTDYT